MSYINIIISVFDDKFSIFISSSQDSEKIVCYNIAINSTERRIQLFFFQYIGFSARRNTAEYLISERFVFKGYQLRNKTSGSQGEGKAKIDDYRPSKGYYDGIKQGKKTLAKELSHIAEKHLEIRLKPEKHGNKVSEKQYEKFMALISENTYEESD